MVRSDLSLCPICGVQMRYYDQVRRVVRTAYEQKYYIYLKRVRCPKCKHVHRVIPDVLFPYKHYEAKIIFDVVYGSITYETLGYEDYPCELTMRRWIRNARFLQGI